jgi:hypothetical protein
MSPQTASRNLSFSATESRGPIWPQWAAKALACLLAAGCVVVSPNAHTQPGSNEYPVSSARSSQADPPGRVGKISLISGPVSLTDLQSNDTENATLNWPITTAHRLSTGRTGRVEVRIGSIAVRLDDESVVDFNRIDDEVVQIMVQRGSVALRLRNREILREIDVLTPRERIAFDDVGRYRLDVDRATGITALTAYVGAARISSGRSSFLVQSGQRGEVTAPPGVGFQLVTPSTDIFDDWVMARDRRDDASRSAQYVSRETTGVESLDEHGHWSSAPEYGPIWYPAYVPAGWAPYRFGRWIWMSPWGWTWVDDAPWGFAPFHYGRWVIVGGRWCWAPGRWIARPYYAPALVAWYGRPGVSITITSGYPVGWFPLGWGDVYYPTYYHSPRYIRSVNIQNVTTINNVTVINPPSQFVHQRHPDSVSWAPARSLPRRDRVQDVMTTRPPEDLVRTGPVARSPVVVGSEFSKRTLPVMADGVAPVRPTPRGGTIKEGQVPQPALVNPGNESGERVRIAPPGSAVAAPGGVKQGIAPQPTNPTSGIADSNERVRVAPPRTTMPENPAPNVTVPTPKRAEIAPPQPAPMQAPPTLRQIEVAPQRPQPVPQWNEPAPQVRGPKHQAPPQAAPAEVAPPRIERPAPPQIQAPPRPQIERVAPPPRAPERVEAPRPKQQHNEGPREESRGGGKFVTIR